MIFFLNFLQNTFFENWYTHILKKNYLHFFGISEKKLSIFVT
jgi:hypothetical protein